MRTNRNLRCRIVLVLGLLGIDAHLGYSDTAEFPSNRYVPVQGGYRIHISETAVTSDSELLSVIGVVKDNPRLHRRPLFPPADRSVIWSSEQRSQLQRVAFRPLVLAYNEPRFLFDYHTAGGLLGHLFAGLVNEKGTGKWFHEWETLDVRFVQGRMEYAIQDSAFPGITVRLSAAPLAKSAGLALRLSCHGLEDSASLVWAYGGASAFTTNYAMTAPEFTFSPVQCEKNFVSWDRGAFTLRRPFDDDDVYRKVLPEWEASIRGGSSRHGESGLGEPEAFLRGPQELFANAETAADATGKERKNSVAVERIELNRPADDLFIVVGMGGDIEKALQAPAAAYTEALERNHEIGSRILTQTPDSYLDASMQMMAYATEGLWGDTAYLHGGWSWRSAYLGWRGTYGPTCYGWTERVKTGIRNHATLGVIREGPDRGAICHMLESQPKGTFYNMNEVFLDQVRQYFDYTGDLAFMREILPVLEGILEWENRRLQPENAFLYENSLNTWISDSHWNIGGQCTQASAYMLAAHNFLAELYTRLGRKEQTYRERAERIRKAMQEELWMPRQGVFAEYRDTRGHRMLHTEPELPTIYHSAEFGAADPLQVYEMLHWADTHLQTVSTAGDGKLYWSSNWFPNHGRSYTHSTHEMAYAEELNLALTNDSVGRADEAYAILRAALCGIFNGPTPGGLACHTYTDGRQRANDEFADAISMWGRTVTEGLFGIVPKRADKTVHLTPLFPSGWKEASIETPHFSYSWKHEKGRVSIHWKSPVSTTVRLRLALQAGGIEAVSCNGENTAYRLEPGVGFTWVSVETPPGHKGVIEVIYAPRSVAIPAEIDIRQGQRFRYSSSDLRIDSLYDPQGLLDRLVTDDGHFQGIVDCEPGPGLLFAFAHIGACPVNIPLRLRVEPKTQPPPPNVWKPPILPSRDMKHWILSDLSRTYNARLTEVPQRIVDTAQPPPLPLSQVGFRYRADHWNTERRLQRISDEAWRNKVDADGVAWCADGIPFRTSKEGSNIGVVSLVGDFPSRLEFPVQGRGTRLFLMLSGYTFPAQSHVVNLRVTLKYADGEEIRHDLVNPFDIGDCWGTWCGRYHDTAANGFENLGGQFGPAGSIDVADMSEPVNVDTEAHLLGYTLHEGVALRSVELEAIADDLAFGLMGATILKAE